MTSEHEKTAWLERVLGIRLAPAVPDGAADPMANWTAARAAALTSLKALENAYRGMKHPLTDPAIILLRAIQANLTPEPVQPAQIQELTAYLNGDQIIAEAESPIGFGLDIQLRVPLLAALDGLKQARASDRPAP